VDSTQQAFARNRSSLGFVLSTAIHGLALLALLASFAPIFVRPSLNLKGQQGTATIVYLAPRGAALNFAPARPKEIKTFKTTHKKSIPLPKPQREAEKPEVSKEPPTSVAAAGTASGSQFEGSAMGDEVRPALPVVSPDPPVPTLPAGIQGDVIVEVTIDAGGLVTDTKLLQTIGYGIEEKVMATLRTWRYTPATRNGSPIPSKLDVHFHFPT